MALLAKIFKKHFEIQKIMLTFALAKSNYARAQQLILMRK